MYPTSSRDSECPLRSNERFSSARGGGVPRNHTGAAEQPMTPIMTPGSTERFERFVITGFGSG